MLRLRSTIVQRTAADHEVLTGLPAAVRGLIDEAVTGVHRQQATTVAAVVRIIHLLVHIVADID